MILFHYSDISKKVFTICTSLKTMQAQIKKLNGLYISIDFWLYCKNFLSNIKSSLEVEPKTYFLAYSHSYTVKNDINFKSSFLKISLKKEFDNRKCFNFLSLKTLFFFFFPRIFPQFIFDLSPHFSSLMISISRNKRQLTL